MILQRDIDRLIHGTQRVALNIPLRNIPAYIAKTKAKLEKFRRGDQLVVEIQDLDSLASDVIKEKFPYYFSALKDLDRSMKFAIDNMEIFQSNIRYMFISLSDFGMGLTKEGLQIAEYIVSKEFVKDLIADEVYPLDISDDDLKEVKDIAQALIRFYQTVEEFKKRVRVSEKHEETLKVGEVETLYHVSIHARDLYQKGFSMTMPKENSGMGLGGSQSTKSGQVGISFTYDRNNAREMYRLFRELHDALKGKLKARTVVDAIERSRDPENVWKEWFSWSKKRWPETPLEIAYLHYLYTRLSKDRSPIWILNARQKFLPNLAKVSASDIGILVAEVDMSHDDVTFQYGEREYRVPPEAVIQIKKVIQ